MNFDYLFEVSSEAGRKVGGIYTVLRSKSEELVKLLENKYFLFGMYDGHAAKKEFAEDDAPADVQEALNQLKKEGITCYWGRWKKGSNARLILIDAWEYSQKEVDVDGAKMSMANAIKKILWKDYAIDSVLMGADFNTNVSWAYATGLVIKKLLELERFRGRKVVAHFHEWISGAGLLYLKTNLKHVALVFTTHATSLGRTLASSGRDLVTESLLAKKEGRKIDDGEAYKHKLEGQHLLEKASAEQAHVFTTVSEITAKETEYVLGKSPDIVTPNALSFKEYEPTNMLIKKSFMNREKIKSFLRAYFLPYYPVRLHNCPILYISGRYEVIDKGIDLFIDTLAKLNAELKRTKYDRTVFAFIFVPSNIRRPKPELVNNMRVLEQIGEVIDDALAIQKDNFIVAATKGGTKDCNMPGVEGNVKDLLRSFEKAGNVPPLCAYQLNYANDKIMTLLTERGLTNKEEDKVKVIFYPTYLKESDGLLNMPYYEVINGLDIGVFPSRYEPWGYTPIEAGAVLNVAFTTDYAGYGRFILSHAKDNPGIKVIKMEGMNHNEIVNSLENEIELLANMPRDNLRQMKIEAKRVAELSDWESQIENYIQAYDRAISKL